MILILIDTLRPDHLPFYGYPRDTAPFLTRLAEESSVFMNAFSTSAWTAPSTASLFTARYPRHHGVTLGLQVQRAQVELMRQRMDFDVVFLILSFSQAIPFSLFERQLSHSDAQDARGKAGSL